MRLVACPQCRKQHDLTDVERNAVRCRCGEMVENREPQGLDLEVHRCSACGGSVDEGAERCEYCGVEIVRSRYNLSLICPSCFARNSDADRFCSGCGLHFQPVQVDAAGQEVICPDCEVPLQPHLVGQIRIAECPSCNGLWVPGDRFDALVEAALDARKQADPAQLEAAPPRKVAGNPASQRVAYRKCLRCGVHMARRNFRKTSGVIIDRCRDHGTWLDADELERIAGFLTSGGRPEADWYIRAEDAAAKRSVARESRPLTTTTSTDTVLFGSGRSRHDRRGSGLLTRILQDLLD